MKWVVIVVDDNKERLQKVLAASGVASRRKSEEYITSGRVKVNGVTVTELGTKVSKNDEILVDNKPIKRQEHVYFVLNKPSGCITTVRDDKGRRTVMDFITAEDKKTRIFPVGILETDISGALILTNDGDLSYRLTKSHKEIEKTYQVRINGIIDQRAVTALIKGVEIDGVMTKRSKVDIISIDKKNESSLLMITITDSKNRLVQKMLESLGYEVKKLKRVSFGDVSIEDMPVGSYRMLKPHEVKKLYSL